MLDIGVIGDKASLATVIAGQHAAVGKVRGFVREWCARKDFEPLTSKRVVWCSVGLVSFVGGRGKKSGQRDASPALPQMLGPSRSSI